MKDEKINLQKCRPSKDRILRMAAYNRIVRSFRSSHFTEELQAHKIWRITNLAEYYDPEDAPRVPEYRGQFPMFVLPVEATAQKSGLNGPRKGDRLVADGSCDATTGENGASGFDKHRDMREEGETAESCNSPAESSKPSRANRFDEDGAQRGMHTSGTDVASGDTDAADVSEGEQLEGICVVCIEKSALFVMHECGHLIFCPGCRRKAVAKELKESGKTQWKSVKPQQLSNKELERTKVRCPICREESVAVAQKKFSGKVYT